MFGEDFLKGEVQGKAHRAMKGGDWEPRDIWKWVKGFTYAGYSSEYIRGYWYGHGWLSNSIPMKRVGT